MKKVSCEGWAESDWEKWTDLEEGELPKFTTDEKDAEYWPHWIKPLKKIRITIEEVE